MRGYLAARDREAELLEELGRAGARVLERHGRLFVTDDGPRHAAWACNVWANVESVASDSIAEAARALLARSPRWAHYSPTLHRRAALIRAALPPLEAKRYRFGVPLPQALGSFALVEPGRLLVSTKCSSAFPNGEVEFVETSEPPSRAYLKLWELFTITSRKPRAGESCLDLGASPGGWTWVLAKLGARVTAVDKAELAPQVARSKGVQMERCSAFALDPRTHPPVDWLFSDVICYPARLLEHVRRWLDSGKARNLVCTLKFQGSTDHEVAREFARIPGSRLQHLHHNKHELTWWRFER